MVRLFIDPASKSTGWAIFDGKELVEHGTITTDPTKKVHIRLYDLHRKIRKQFVDWKFDMINVEQQAGRPNHYVLWSVGMFATALGDKTEVFKEKPNAARWKCAVGLPNVRAKGAIVKEVFDKLFPNVEVESDDEVEAILMGWTEVNADT